jgi:P4 family phage/plasmid primase-like protien
MAKNREVPPTPTSVVAEDAADGARGGSDPLKFDKLASRYQVAKNYRGRPGVVYFHNLFWVYDPLKRHAWVPYSELEMQIRMLQWLARSGITSSPEVANNTTKMLRARCLLDRQSEEPMPFWLTQEVTDMPALADVTDIGSMIVLQNGMIAVSDLEDGHGPTLYKHDPSWFTRVCLPYSYDPSARCPGFLKWLGERTNNDTDLIAMIQELFGLFLTPWTKYQIAMALIGPAASGKGTLLNVLRHLVGGGNTQDVPLHELSEKYVTEALYGKSLMICDEVSTISETAENVFKWLVGGNNLANRPMYSGWYNAKPTVRLIMAMNAWPRFKDETDALYRRFKLIPFDKALDTHKMDPDMDTKLKTETPGIFNWALEGLTRLIHKGWTISETSEARIAAERATNQPWRQWIFNHLTPDPQGRAQASDLFRKYQNWARSASRKRSLSLANFVAAINKDIPESGSEWAFNKSRNKVLFVTGVKLRPVSAT